MEYKKPEVVAQNATTGLFAAGCPAERATGGPTCKTCERTA